MRTIYVQKPTFNAKNRYQIGLLTKISLFIKEIKSGYILNVIGKFLKIYCNCKKDNANWRQTNQQQHHFSPLFPSNEYCNWSCWSLLFSKIYYGVKYEHVKKTCGRKHPRQIVIIVVNLRKLFYSIWYFWTFVVLRFVSFIDYQYQIMKSNFKIIFKNCIMIHLLVNIIQIRKKASTTGHEISFLLFMVMKILYSRNLNDDERFDVIYELFWKINLDYFY